MRGHTHQTLIIFQIRSLSSTKLTHFSMLSHTLVIIITVLFQRARHHPLLVYRLFPRIQRKFISLVEKLCKWNFLLFTISPLQIIVFSINLSISIKPASYPKIFFISRSSSSNFVLPYPSFTRTKRSSNVSSSVILNCSRLSNIKNWTRLNKPFGSSPVASVIHLLYINSNS